MSSLEESIASWAGIISTLLTVVGLIQSRPWLTIGSFVCLGGSLFAAFYARRERLLLNAASITIEGRSIDSLNLANLRRHVNRSLIVQDAVRVAEIQGQDLKISVTYSGFCRAKRETAIEFSLDSDTNTPFDELECFAYDLLRDREKKHPIRPILLGTDGSSKKIAIPFLEPLEAHQPFKILLSCSLPGCMKAGVEYYAAALSFAQDQVPRSTVKLLFVGDLPDWVRVYEITTSGKTKLLRDLRPSGERQDLREYTDVAENVAGKSARVYVFHRPAFKARSAHAVDSSLTLA
jgi:hypothetical protein